MTQPTKNIGVFLIHGITKTNKELELIKQYLEQNKNIKVYLPLLPGHGTCPYSNETCFKLFWQTTPQQWMKYSEKEFLALKKANKFKKIYVGGISLGGNLSLCIAARHKVDGIILIGTPIFLSKILSFAYNCSKIALWLINKIGKKNKKSYKGRYHGLPIARLMMIKKIIDKSKENLKLINKPILIFHSGQDDIAHPRSATYILKNVKSKYKKIVWIDTKHGLERQTQSRFIAGKIADFINNS